MRRSESSGTSKSTISHIRNMTIQCSAFDFLIDKPHASSEIHRLQRQISGQPTNQIMNLKTRLSATLLTLATGLAFAASLPAVAEASATSASSSDPTTPRLVVKYREFAPVEAKVVAGAAVTSTSRERAIAARAHYPLRRVKTVSDGTVVYDLGREVSMPEARAAAARIAADPTVEFAAPDVRVRLAAAGVSNDNYSFLQWPLFPRTSGSGGAAAAGGANFVGAWATTRGANVVVGVIDSGGVASPDLEGQTVPGYDFVSANSTTDFSTAGDGDGRDSDPTDPGNFCAGSGTTPTIYSNWHGLKVASLIVSLADNTYGIAGAAPLAKVMHLRATGRCGGFLTDVADALKWSVGVHIDGIPDNSAPVQVVNLSISSAPGTVCQPYMQAAVDAAIRRNVPVVVAAGNEGVNDVGAPANCVGVVAVGGHTRSGDLDVSSNYSPLVTLTAPSGGRCKSQGADCLSGDIIAAGNTGLTTALRPTEVATFFGTSAAAPHVSAAIALIRSLDLTLTPTQITAILKATAKPHAADSYCAANFGSCGAGMLDASAAVTAAAFPVATITPSYAGPSSPGSTAVVLTAGVTSSMGSTYA